MSEGLGSKEVGDRIAEHAQHDPQHRDGPRRERVLSIAEAALLSVVALLAAWSGYAAAKWSTESSVLLAEASSARTQANQADLEAMSMRNFDSSTFESWFAAYIAGDDQAAALAERRFRPEFKVAFDAWRSQAPETNPNAAPGPTFLPEYSQPRLEDAARLASQADEHLQDGIRAGDRSDRYVRTTVFLASVLFLVGISTQFGTHGVRYGLIGLGVLLLAVSLVQLTLLPLPPR
jgi:hypothetical protein